MIPVSKNIKINSWDSREAHHALAEEISCKCSRYHIKWAHTVFFYFFLMVNHSMVTIGAILRAMCPLSGQN